MATQNLDIDKMLEAECAKELRQMRPNGKAPDLLAGKSFEAIGDERYRLTVPAIGVVIQVDRLRREHHELVGELSVDCGLPGARTVEGNLSTADLNLSSARARQERAKLLAARSNTRDVDWMVLIEEFAQRVLQADRAGQPAVDLRELPRPDADADMIEVEGIALPKRHPSIVFGDGGSLKSYTGLYIAGKLAERGFRVGFYDWELCGEDHRDRLERLFPDGMPQIFYVRCERPLVHEADRLRRIVQEHEIQYSIYDSVAFACDGPPESAEIAGKYFRAVRQIGGGSLHIAHVTKGEGADRKPFGSTFWHNGARSTWFAKVSEESQETDSLRVGLFNRKSNLGKLRPPVGLSITFDGEQTLIRRVEVADSPDLAGQLSIRQRVTHLLKRGPLTVTQISEELDVEVNTVTQTVNRYVNKGRLFIVLEGKNTNRKIGLLDL